MFEFVRDESNLRRYLAGIEDGAAWVKVREGRHPRIEWGAEGTGYHGWFEIDREGEVCSITAELHDDHLPAADLDAALDAALFALKREIEEGRRTP